MPLIRPKKRLFQIGFKQIKKKLCQKGLRYFEGFKNKQKSVWSNIFWEFIEYIIHWDKTNVNTKQML